MPTNRPTEAEVRGLMELNDLQARKQFCFGVLCGAFFTGVLSAVSILWVYSVGREEGWRLGKEEIQRQAIYEGHAHMASGFFGPMFTWNQFGECHEWPVD